MNNKFVLIKTILFMAAIVGIIIYVRENFEAISNTIQGLSINWVAFIFILYLIILYNQAKMLRVSSTLIQEKRTPLNDLMLVNGISSLVGNFIPSGAIASKPLLIQKLIEIPLANAILSVSRVTITNLFANLILLSIIIGYALPINLATQACIIIFVVAAYYVSMYPKPIMRVGFIFNLIKRVRMLIKPESNKNGVVLLLRCLIQILLFGLIFWSYLTAVGEESAFLKALTISLAGNLTMLIAVTPGNLGVKEGVYFILSQKLAINAEVVVSIILIDRLVQITCLIFVNMTCWVLYKNKAH